MIKRRRGRPKVVHRKRSSTFWLDGQLLEKLAVAARRRGYTTSRYVREIVVRELAGESHHDG